MSGYQGRGRARPFLTDVAFGHVRSLCRFCSMVSMAAFSREESYVVRNIRRQATRVVHQAES